MYSLAFLFAVTVACVDCKLSVSQLLKETCSKSLPIRSSPVPPCSPVPVCAPPVPACAPPLPHAPPVAVCASPVPVCTQPVQVCSPTVAVCEVTRTCAAIPFVTDLLTCPDIYFTDILLSPIGSLDPIFPIYGCPELAPPEAPCSPVKALTCSCGPPPGFTEDYSCDCFLKRGCIPPPFI